MAGRAHKLESQRPADTGVSSIAEARRLIAIIEKSQIPFGESAPLYNRIKAEVDAGKMLEAKDHETLLDLVRKAQEWEKAVQSSARTLPEETLPG